MRRPVYSLIRSGSHARALSALFAAALLGVLLLAVRASPGPRASLPARHGAPTSDWALEQATLSDQALAVERGTEKPRTRRADGSGHVLLQNALGIERAGAGTLVRTRTRAWQPHRLVRSCVTARGPPRR